MPDLILAALFVGVIAVFWFWSVREPAGVRGWLLLLCLTLVILYPFYLARMMGDAFRASDLLKHEYPRMETIAFLHSFVGLGLTVFSIYTGIRLWGRRPTALVTAKRFLLVTWTFTLVFGFLPLTAGLPHDANALLLRRFLLGVLKISVYCGLWWWYLSRSKRVAMTYRVV